MATITVLCPACHTDNVIQFGKTRQGKQRYRCRNETCEKNTFLFHYTYNGHKQEVKEKIIEMALNASGIRDTARVLKVSMNTVMTTIKKSRSARKRQSKILRSP